MIEAVSYTHLDVYKRQVSVLAKVPDRKDYVNMKNKKPKSNKKNKKRR